MLCLGDNGKVENRGENWAQETLCGEKLTLLLGAHKNILVVNRNSRKGPPKAELGEGEEAEKVFPLHPW